MPLKPQARVILAILQDAGGEWVTGREFHSMYLPCYSQRISELNRWAEENGAKWRIKAEREFGYTTYRYRFVRIEGVAA